MPIPPCAVARRGLTRICPCPWPTLLARTQVKGYPTLKVLHNGEEYKPYKGARDFESIKAFILEAAKELLTEAE